ncbi:PREDICTED: uncharacterized protein LOC105555676 [Vollenhovia emeryi]|uniref:uncharacterized protein LOC105555676 n=1 Tax=Vollenhovia emeryi TaxID=411798 RepID=UPI0005F4E2D1|nr:PREDICTED: uncharacterized protein LOC105555676 [Vollenhovia emeryi]
MPLVDEDNTNRDAGNSNSGQLTGQLTRQIASGNTINIDFFDVKQQTFRRWLQRLEGAFRFFKIQEGQEKVAYLLHFLGVEAFGILCDRLDPQDPYLLPYDALLNKLKEYYAPEPLEIAEIFVFRKRLQLPEESAQEYMAALQKLSLYCKFGEYLKTELRNQFVFGLRNQRIQGRLLETANLTMESALKTASGMELAEKGVNELKSEAAAAVDFVGSNGKALKKKTDNETKVKGHSKNYKPGRRTNSCGQNHLAPDCTLPRHVKCHECGGFGHLQKVCKKKCKAQLLEEVYRLDEMEHSYFRDKFMVSLSGKSASNLRGRLRSCGHSGFVKVKVRDIDCIRELNMYVVCYDRSPLLGREWINQLGILGKVKSSLREIENIKSLEIEGQVKLELLFKKYPDVLSEEFPSMSKIEARLKLKENAKPVFLKNRVVPFKLKEKVEAELENMVQAGILEKVESSRWATPIVPVLKKNGQIRICGDFSVTVNPLLVVDEHPLPTIDELFASMTGGKIFSKIDLKQAYLQLPVTEQIEKF